MEQQKITPNPLRQNYKSGRRFQHSTLILQTKHLTGEYTERVPLPWKPTLDTTIFKVIWLKNSRLYRCYRCQHNIYLKPQKGKVEAVSPPHTDFDYEWMEFWPIPNLDWELRLSIKLETKSRIQRGMSISRQRSQKATEERHNLNWPVCKWCWESSQNRKHEGSVWCYKATLQQTKQVIEQVIKWNASL